MVDYLPFQYTTGDIPVTEAHSPITGKLYQIFRSSFSYYDSHDPETYLYLPEGLPNGIEQLKNDWTTTLSIDEVGVNRAFNWAFSPGHPLPAARGYSLNGPLSGSTEAFGWSVWVK